MMTFKLRQILLLVASASIYLVLSAGHIKDTSELCKSNIPLIDTSLDGFYSGLEYDRITTDPAYPGKNFKAFHIGFMKIKRDSIFLDQLPIFIHNKDTTYSASDGGFFYWRGVKKQNDTAILFSLVEYYCDYCGILVRKKANGKDEFYPRSKELIARLTPEGLLIKGYLYKKMSNTDTLISERPKPRWTAHY